MDFTAGNCIESLMKVSTRKLKNWDTNFSLKLVKWRKESIIKSHRYLHISSSVSGIWEVIGILNKIRRINKRKSKRLVSFTLKDLERWAEQGKKVLEVTTKSITPSSHSRALPFPMKTCKKESFLFDKHIFHIFNNFPPPSLEPFCALKGNTWILFYLLLSTLLTRSNSQERQSAHDENFSFFLLFDFPVNCVRKAVAK